MWKRFAIKNQDDYFAIIDNYSMDKVGIVNGIRTLIEAEWLCDFMNDLHKEIMDLRGENTRFKLIVSEVVRDLKKANQLSYANWIENELDLELYSQKK